MRRHDSGQILVIAILFLAIIVITSIALFGLISFFTRNSQIGLAKEQALHLAEAGVDKAVWSLNTTGSSYTGEQATALGPGEFSVTLTNVGLYTKDVESTGFIPNSQVATAQRTVKARIALGTEEISFRYATQIGEGGLDMRSNSEINGNAYSNGNIVGASNTQINGDAFANGTISSPDPDVTGTKQEGAPDIPLPVIDLDYWRGEANTNNDPIIGDHTINNSQNFGPRKIQGNLTITGNNTKVTLTGPIHVTGNFTMNSNTDLAIDESFGSAGTVVVVDGSITINSNVEIFATSADPKGYILLVSPYDAGTAINLNADISGGVFYSTLGLTIVNANVDLIAVTAQELRLESNATVNYDIGLQGAIFTSGSGGSWEVVQSSYRITL